jgi:hypothetical protein
MQNRIVIVILAIVAACGGGNESRPIDAAVDAFESTCGEPGDPGNELGIGKFCASLGDCADTQAARRSDHALLHEDLPEHGSGGRLRHRHGVRVQRR